MYSIYQVDYIYRDNDANDINHYVFVRINDIVFHDEIIELNDNINSIATNQILDYLNHKLQKTITTKKFTELDITIVRFIHIKNV